MQPPRLQKVHSFNPRAREGATIALLDGLALRRKVSIHAPVRARLAEAA